MRRRWPIRMKTMDYGTFLSIVAEGRKNVGGGKENVMPAFGDNKNVYCYMDDLYVYLRARAVGAAAARPAAQEGRQAEGRQGCRSVLHGG